MFGCCAQPPEPGGERLGRWPAFPPVQPLSHTCLIVTSPRELSGPGRFNCDLGIHWLLPTNLLLAVCMLPSPGRPEWAGAGTLLFLEVRVCAFLSFHPPRIRAEIHSSHTDVRMKSSKETAVRFSALTCWQAAELLEQRSGGLGPAMPAPARVSFSPCHGGGRGCLGCAGVGVFLRWLSGLQTRVPTVPFPRQGGSPVHT